MVKNLPVLSYDLGIHHVGRKHCRMFSIFVNEVKFIFAALLTHVQNVTHERFCGLFSDLKLFHLESDMYSTFGIFFSKDWNF